ncbi:MAG: tetratricopeptide repeat protein [Verrucomicrobia bacterium]|nr:tetratricopeptide repeat protein [Verrucomicrobiota bacterium]
MLLHWRSLLQALTGQMGEARAGRKLLRELEKAENGWFDSILQVAIGDREEAIQSLVREWPTTDFALRNDLWGDWLYAPWFAPLRDDPRIRAMAMEHKAAIDRELKAAASAGQTNAASTGAGSSVPGAARPDKSVGVLAFTNLSEDKSIESFADGISVELQERLGSVAGLKVAAQRSAFYFKGTHTPIPEIARQLGVAYVVDGTVRRAGSEVRIAAQLIKAADGFRVWGDTFKRELKDLFAVQDEIAGLVAKKLELKLGGRAGPVREIEPAAYQEYLAGRATAAKAGMEDLRRAVTHFERAVAREPAFASAWVQLAVAHTQLGRWGGAPTREAWPAARAALEQAQALDPDSPEVLLAQSWILRTADWDWRGAEQALRKALALRPDHPDTLSATSVLLFNVGKQDEAFRLGRQAAKLDPLNPATQIDLSLMFFFSESWSEAEQTARRAVQLSSTGTGYHAILGWSLVAQKRFAEGEAELAQESSEIERINGLGMLALARGQPSLAREYLAKLDALARKERDWADLQQSIAWLCAGLGEIDRAFAALDKALVSRDPSVAWTRTMWPLRPLHGDARWREYLRQLGLADEQLK